VVVVVAVGWNLTVVVKPLVASLVVKPLTGLARGCLGENGDSGEGGESGVCGLLAIGGSGAFGLNGDVGLVPFSG
jgi:hypothetical protein